MKIKLERVQKASTYKFLDEIIFYDEPFTDKVCKEVMKNTKDLQEAILLGREVAYKLENYPDTTNAPFWEMVLARGLDDVGLIRHDIEKKTILVGEFYEKIGTFASSADIFRDNEKYEIFKNLTPSEYKKVVSALVKRLSDRQLTVIMRRFGLENGEKWTRPEIAAGFSCSSERIRQIENDAIKKLQKHNELPPLWGPVYRESDYFDIY